MGRLLLTAVLLASCAAIPVRSEDAICPSEPRHIKLGPVMMPAMIFTNLALQEAVTNKEAEVVLDIDSPGGGVEIGFEFIDLMRKARASGTKIDCRILPGGMAASMAAVILETGCSTRSMAPDAAILFHEPSVSEFAGGGEWDFRRMADRLADTNKRTAIAVAARLKHSDGRAWTAAEFQAWISGRDRWLDYDEALKMGAVDL